ncbi:unnamed protein product [Arabidopsis halleri]
MAIGFTLRGTFSCQNPGTICIQELIQDHFCLWERGGSHVALQTTSKVIGKGGFCKNSKNIRNRNQMSLDIVLWLLKCKSFADRASFDSASPELSLVYWILR